MYLLCNLFSVSLDFYFREKKEANKFLHLLAYPVS
jgi:hypothetical protein